MHYFTNLFNLLFTLLLFNFDQIVANVELCGQINNESHGLDLSALDGTTWDLIKTKSDNKERVDYSISICSPLNSSVHKECSGSHICKINRTSNEVIGYEPKSIDVESMSGSSIQSAVVLFEGPPCDEDPILNYTIKMRFTCGQHLKYPQHFMDTNCMTQLFWKSYAICKDKSVHDEIKCYVYDNEGLRRDLTPLIKPNGSSYKVLSQDQDFYLNVCSDVSNVCPEPNAGACLKTGDNKNTKVGDYKWNTLEFKPKSAVFPYDFIEMTYRTKSRDACSSLEDNYTSVTTIRFICHPKEQKRSIEFINRNPRLVSNLDCDYQVEWFTEYACPLNEIQVSAAKYELTEEDHRINFDLKSLMKKVIVLILIAIITCYACYRYLRQEEVINQQFVAIPMDQNVIAEGQGGVEAQQVPVPPDPDRPDPTIVALHV